MVFLSEEETALCPCGRPLIFLNTKLHWWVCASGHFVDPEKYTIVAKVVKPEGLELRGREVLEFFKPMFIEFGGERVWES